MTNRILKKTLIIGNDDFVNQKLINVLYNISTSIVNPQFKHHLHEGILQALEKKEFNAKYDIIIIHVPQFFCNTFNQLSILKHTPVKRSPATKLMLVANELDNYIARRLYIHFNPDSFLISNPINYEIVADYLKRILAEESVYSHQMLKILRTDFIFYKKLDEYDRTILYFLNQGVKIKDIQVPLSEPTIEKRINQMSKYFRLESYERANLLKAAKLNYRI